MCTEKTCFFQSGAGQQRTLESNPDQVGSSQIDASAVECTRLWTTRSSAEHVKRGLHIGRRRELVARRTWGSSACDPPVASSQRPLWRSSMLSDEAGKHRDNGIVVGGRLQ
jgi:hypothetical protein